MGMPRGSGFVAALGPGVGAGDGVAVMVGDGVGVGLDGDAAAAIGPEAVGAGVWPQPASSPASSPVRSAPSAIRLMPGQ